MNKQIFKNTTLVPVDFSEASGHALEHASAIAKIIEDGNPRITLLHVIEGANFEPVTDDTKLEGSGRDALSIEGARMKIRELMKQYESKVNVMMDYLIVGGKPYRKIAEIAEDIDADSIVMGSRGAHGWQRFVGSTASRVIQLAPCPVVTISDRHIGSGYKNIVLPLDLTKETKQKVSWAIKLAKYFNSTVHIITISEGDEFLARRIKANLRQVENVLAENNVKTTSTYLTERSDNFAEATLHFAQGRNADLIIIMTQQEKTFSEFIFGSYAQQIVNTSKIPVIAINPRIELQGILEKIV